MVKFDEGIKIVSRNRWKTFGKFIINYNDLDDLKLNIRYISGSQVPKMKKQDISIELYNVISSLIDTGEINYTLIKDLKDKEKELLDDLIIRAGLKKQLNFKPSKMEMSTSDLKNKFNILSGEIEAGNNSPKVKQDLTEVINKLVAKRVISKANAVEMLNELKEIK